MAIPGETRAKIEQVASLDRRGRGLGQVGGRGDRCFPRYNNKEAIRARSDAVQDISLAFETHYRGGVSIGQSIGRSGKKMPALEGKVALVTGASRGIGRAIAVRLGREQASVVVNYSLFQKWDSHVEGG